MSTTFLVNKVTKFFGMLSKRLELLTVVDLPATHDLVEVDHLVAKSVEKGYAGRKLISHTQNDLTVLVDAITPLGIQKVDLDRVDIREVEQTVKDLLVDLLKPFSELVFSDLVHIAFPRCLTLCSGRPSIP
jgi:hypothetical protein